MTLLGSSMEAMLYRSIEKPGVLFQLQMKTYNRARKHVVDQAAKERLILEILVVLLEVDPGGLLCYGTNVIKVLEGTMDHGQRGNKED